MYLATIATKTLAKASYFACHCCLGIPIFACILSTCFGSEVGSLEANELLAKVAKVYSRCNTYYDRGSSTTTLQLKSGKLSQLKYEFQTAFVRGQKLSFAFQKNAFDLGFGKPDVLWHDNQQTLITRIGRREMVAVKSLSIGVARFTGISSGTAHYIPVLLKPKAIAGVNTLDIGKHEPIKELKFGAKKQDCYFIEATARGCKTSLWIDQQSLLILRIDEEYSVNGKPRHSTTNYFPAIDQDVPAHMFDLEALRSWKPVVTLKSPTREEARVE